MTNTNKVRRLAAQMCDFWHVKAKAMCHTAPITVVSSDRQAMGSVSIAVAVNCLPQCGHNRGAARHR